MDNVAKHLTWCYISSTVDKLMDLSQGTWYLIVGLHIVGRGENAIEIGNTDQSPSIHSLVSVPMD
jgi:hypothetical protein